MTTNAVYLLPFQSFGLNENPFHVSPDLRYYQATPATQSAYAELCYGIQRRKGLMVLTGVPGVGKTILLHRLLQWLRANSQSASYVFHCHLGTEDLLRSIFQGFGIVHPGQSKMDLLRALSAWLDERTAAGDSPVVIVDEAQGLSIRALDELRLLLNLETANGKLLQIVLAGQPELDEKLRRPQLLQLRQRMSVRAKLPIFSLEQCADYIETRLTVAGKKLQDTFPPETISAIHAYSGGIPRVMNLLCENALLSSYAAREASVSPEMVRAVAAEFDLETKNLTCKYSAIPMRAEILGRQEPDEPAEPRHLPEPIPFHFAETKSLNSEPKPVHQAADRPHSLAVIDQPKKTTNAPVGAAFRKTLSAFLAPAKDYCRAVLQSFSADWRRFAKSFAYSKSQSGRTTLPATLQNPKAPPRGAHKIQTAKNAISETPGQESGNRWHKEPHRRPSRGR